MAHRRLVISVVAVAVWVGMTAAVAFSAQPAGANRAAEFAAATTSQTPATSDSPTTSSTPSTSGTPSTSITSSTSSAPTTTSVTSTTTVTSTSTAPTTSNVPSTSVVPNPGNRTVTVSAGPAGTITVAVTDMVLSLESWDISGFDVLELEQRYDRIEIELTNGDTEVDLEVRLKDSGYLDIRLEVD